MSDATIAIDGQPHTVEAGSIITPDELLRLEGLDPQRFDAILLGEPGQITRLTRPITVTTGDQFISARISTATA